MKPPYYLAGEMSRIRLTVVHSEPRTPCLRDYVIGLQVAYDRHVKRQIKAA